MARGPCPINERKPSERKPSAEALCLEMRLQPVGTSIVGKAGPRVLLLEKGNACVYSRQLRPEDELGWMAEWDRRINKDDRLVLEEVPS